MPRSHFAPLERGIESWIDGDDGVRETGTATIGIFCYESGDNVPKQAVPIAQLIARSTDPETSLITRRLGPNAMTMDPAQLRDIPPTTPATLGFRLIVADERPLPRIRPARCRTMRARYRRTDRP